MEASAAGASPLGGAGGVNSATGKAVQVVGVYLWLQLRGGGGERAQGRRGRRRQTCRVCSPASIALPTVAPGVAAGCARFLGAALPGVAASGGAGGKGGSTQYYDDSSQGGGGGGGAGGGGRS